MSYRTYFTFAVGLSKPLRAPKGTLAAITKHVAEVEESLRLARQQYGKNPPHWTRASKEFPGLDDKIVCRVVSRHNEWVRRLYDDMVKWQQNPVRGGDTITPEVAAGFWHALEMLAVSPDRWTADYYRERMDCLYAVMRGRETEGISFDSKKPLTPEQAGAVVLLFSEFLDTHDIRLAAPVGRDHLAASYDGGYSWSSTCGAIAEDDCYEHARKCRKKDCDVRETYRDDD